MIYILTATRKYKDLNENSSQFVELFYFQYLKGTKYYLREYLTRRLGIYNFDDTFKNIFVKISTRLFLLSSRNTEPKYVKYFNLNFKQYCQILVAFCKHPHYNKSPIINLFMVEIMKEIQELYEEY